MKTIYASPEDNLQTLFDSLEPHTTVILKAGYYFQKAVLAVPNIVLCGEDAVIAFDDHAKRLNKDGIEMGTFHSYTLAVVADNVTIRNLEIRNTAGDPSVLGQQVALYVNGTNFVAENCTLVSTQDTLFCGPLPDDLVVRYLGFLEDKLRLHEGQTFQKFVNCKICGTVDFIFGCANALFDNCEIVSVADGRDIGYVAAPAHPLANTCGFVFYRCNLVGCDAPTVYLARAWRDFGKATFIDCTYGQHIADCGFINWQGTNRQRTSRFYEYSTEQHHRVDWSKTLTQSQAQSIIDNCKTLFDF